MKVYVITQGEYSDYHILGVSLDRERAERIVQLYHDDNALWDQPIIEEYETDVIDVQMQGLLYTVTRTAAGIILNRTDYDLEQDLEHLNKVEKGARLGGIPQPPHVIVMAKNREQALKKASDLFAEYDYRKAMEEEQ